MPSTFVPPVPDFCWLAVIFGSACAGHAILIILNLNRVYGLALPRRFLRVVRRTCYLVTLAGPVLFAVLLGWNCFPAPPTLADAAFSFRTAYVWLCAAVGLAWIPAITLYRLWRRQPPALKERHVEMVDVARQLGFAPSGQGKHRRLCRLPFNQVFQVDFVETTLCLPRLPAAWDGLTVLHLTDLHLCGTPDKSFYQYVIDRCRDWDPDVVALTGDIVDTTKHHRWIIPLLSKLRWRHVAFAVMGNHDYYHDPRIVRRRLSRLGFRVLMNSWELVDVHGAPLVAIGHEGPWLKPAPDLTDCPTEPFRLCLSHTPDNVRWARRNGVDLMLAGHNHGGQIRFPLFGSLFVPSIYSRRYDCGTFDEPPTLLHVGRGIAGQHPLRFNCRPEVTKFVLRREAGTGSLGAGGRSQGAGVRRVGASE